MRWVGCLLIIFGSVLFSGCFGPEDAEEAVANANPSSDDPKPISVSPLTFSGLETASNQTSKTIQLNWTHVEGSILYLIYKIDGETVTYTGSVEAPGTSYVASNLNEGTSYKFRVRLLDKDGLMDDNTNDLTTSTLDITYPNELSDLKLWLKADSIQGLNNGAKIASWEDDSGNENDAVQATNTQKPKYRTNVLNGWPVVRFDGNNDYLEGTLGSVSAPFSILTVAYFTSNNQGASNYDYVINIGNGTSSANASISRHANTGGNKNKYYTWDGAIHLGPVLAGKAWTLLTAFHLAASPFHHFFKNGTSETVADYSSAVTVNGDYDLGRYGPSNTHHLKGDIAEILIFSKGLSVSERQQMECYLSDKYALTGDYSC